MRCVDYSKTYILICLFQRVAESQTTLTEEEEAAEDVGGSQQEDRAHLVTQVRQDPPLQFPYRLQSELRLLPCCRDAAPSHLSVFSKTCSDFCQIQLK